MNNLAIDLCCGKGGWAEGLIAAGFDVIGFDIEQHKGYPGQLVLQDVRTIHGRQFKDAKLIVASPPCTEFSRFGKPCWFDVASLAPPDLSIVKACRRIAQESELPMILENVRDAQPFIGRATAHLGSFYLWGDIPALLPHKLVRGCKHTHSQRGEKHRCACDLTNRNPANRAKIPFGLSRFIGECYA